MKNVKIMWGCFLLVGLAGFSYAGFKDALKAAGAVAGGVVNGSVGAGENATQDITPAETVVQFDFTKMLGAEETTKWRTALAEAIKKDCAEVYRGTFTPAPTTGWSTTLIAISASPRRLRISEAERAEVIGVIKQGTKTYVLLPDYVYATGVVNPQQSEVTKIPYSMMYHRKAGELKEFYDVMLDGIAAKKLDAEDMAKVIEICKSFCEQEEINLQEEINSGFAEDSSPLGTVFENIYNFNTKIIYNIVGVELEKTKFAEKENAAEKERKDAKIARAKAIAEWDEASAVARADAMKGKTIVFKSLYLGMPITDAYQILSRGLDAINDPAKITQLGITGFLAPEMDDWIPLPRILNVLLTTPSQVPFASETPENLFALVMSLQGVVAIIEANPKGEVVRIGLSTSVVDKLFAASGMDGPAFAKQFVEAYSIPKMDVAGTRLNPVWTYTSKDGAKLTIDYQKLLVLEKVASQQDLKKSFN